MTNLGATAGHTIVTLIFTNRDATPMVTKIWLSSDSVLSVLAWYGAFYAGDRYSVTLDGRKVPLDRNGEPA